MNPLAKRGLKPIEHLAQNRSHGDRLRYMAGCRCDECRRANAAYKAERLKARSEGDWNGVVPADKALAHLKWLASGKLSYVSIAAASSVGKTIINEIIAGRKKRIRARTERAILAVTLPADESKSA